MIFFNGVPKKLINKGSSGQDLKDRLSFAKQKWFLKHGNHLVTMDEATSEEARKLFKFIDYNNAGVISKH